MTVSGVAVASILRSRVDEEPLSILGHRVHLVGADHPSRKKRLWQPGREGIGRVDRHRRHRPVASR